MEAVKMNRRLPPTIIALIFAVGVIFFAGTTAFAADMPIQTTPAETLTVDDVWLTGGTLHIAVTDNTSGGSQTLELNLSDYAKPGDEYVTIQATDSAGRTSNTIQFKNPYYVPAEENTDNENMDGENSGNAANATTERTDPSESAVSEDNPASWKPFTPDGTGSVVDNATDGDGKEFFTVETLDGNVFYLIVDRQRNSENVYLLNAVTEDDLNALAKPGNGSVSAIATPEVAPTLAPIETTPSPAPEPEPTKSGGNKGMLGIIVVVLIVVGGIGYYFKIVRPKKNDYDYEAEEDTDVTEDTETSEDYDEPGEEEPLSYATSDDEAAALERDESEVGNE